MLQPSDFNTNLQVYLIHENGQPVTYLDFPTESAAQGYIDTFGGTRDLEIVHYVKVRDSKRDNVPSGHPTLWVCQRKIGSDIIYMGNPHVAQASADFWTGIYGGPNATYKTKLLAEFVN